MIFEFIGKSFRSAAQVACAALCTVALVSCGGGGGSAGAIPGQKASPTIASLTLMVASPQLLANTPLTSGVNLTAIAKDANNNGVSGVTVVFSADSGEVIDGTSTTTDATGMINATLGTGGNTTPRTIHITATAGGQSATGSLQVVGSGSPTMTLLFSSPTIPSSGFASGNVTVTAVLADANNNAMSGIPVAFTSNSGVLVVTTATTGTNGQAVATLSTAGNPVNRTITVSASGGGVAAQGTVAVTGTSISSSSAPASLTINVRTKFLFTVQDSSGNSLPNVPITFKSAVGNTVVSDPTNAGTPSAIVSNSNGTFILDVTPTVSGSDTLTVSGDGASTGVTFTTTSQSLSATISDTTTTPATVVSISPQPLVEYINSACLQVNATYLVGSTPTTGAANVSTSRGTLYTNPQCTTTFAVGSQQPIVNGALQPLYLNSSTAGLAIVTVSEITGNVSGPTQTASVNFIAQLVSTSQPSVSMNASPSSVAPNTNAAAPLAQFSVITATVRDGTPSNNLVQGVPVAFTLSQDASGGTISPQVVVTGANGAAQTNYYPGPGTTARNGVLINANIQGPIVAPKPGAVNLTVSGLALFVTLGTGNTIDVVDETTYQQKWAVFVTDSAGHAVQNATVTGLMIATSYTKGGLIWDGLNWVLGYPSITNSSLPIDGLNPSGSGSGPWCQNTDIAQDGVWSITNPPFSQQIFYPNVPPTVVNEYPFVMPGIPGNVTSSGVTDVNGYALLTITYPKDHALWTNVSLTATASTIGTQSTAQVFFGLEGVTGDYSSETSAPPGATSPYGINSCHTAF